MSRVYKLYLPTYLPRPSDFARRLFFEPEATRTTRSIVPSHPHPLALRPATPFPSRRHDSTTSRRPPRHSSRACVRAPAACLCPCVFNDSSFRFRNERSFTDGQPPRAPQGEGERMAPLLCCETDEFLYPDRGRPLAGDFHLPHSTEMCEIPSICCV